MSSADGANEAATGPANGGHPTNGLSDTVHQRNRLGILTIAAEAERVEVAYLRDALELTAGNLSRHLAVLEEADLIQVERGYHGRRPKTWIRITQQGQTALTAEINALRQLLQRHQQLGSASRPGGHEQ
ncbi:DNA-binding MarR family transcriptional regulator [Micromonospora luteifusca]|uniref:DNA-binding MarR family transcriptional regulator n=1 Tax=Micromonospora luteifusca TaxID=709860 RepID=A0ABS2LU78_9ACTN|nr:transcriptional regulator [Micromonospora luteifusca]MBM7491746.1 DNA-binding MarR family transcriptional regulator [Micromonospora luteifusca]